MRRMRDILRHLRPNRYWVDADTYVESLGRTGLRYHELDRTLFVDSEWGVENWIGVWPDSIKEWDPPHQADPLTPADRDRIRDNVLRALERAGFRVDVPTTKGWSSDGVASSDIARR
jgi:hypothetical protein